MWKCWQVVLCPVTVLIVLSDVMGEVFSARSFITAMWLKEQSGREKLNSTFFRLSYFLKDRKSGG